LPLGCGVKVRGNRAMFFWGMFLQLQYMRPVDPLF
jgi:hypothetical protein